MRVKFGLAIPNCCEGLIYPLSFANYDSMIEISKEAEALGYDSVWANDHLTTQRYVKEYLPEPPNYYEPLITLSFVAEATRRIKLGTSVVVLPLRDPILLAKQVSTLDVLSRGRVILGVGLGAYKEEFEILNLMFKRYRRSEIMEEGLQVLKRALEEETVDFEGKYFKYKSIELYPKPIQKPFPIWIGGNSPNVISRVAELGEGWLPALLTPEEVRKSAETICKYADKKGRDPHRIEIAPTYVVCISKSHGIALKNFRKSWVYKHLVSLKHTTLKNQTIESYEERNFIGTPDEIINKIDKLIEAGVTYFSDLVFPVENVTQFRKNIKFFAEEVMQSFR